MSDRELAIRNILKLLRSPIALSFRGEREAAMDDARRLNLTAADLLTYLDDARKAASANAKPPAPLTKREERHA